MKVFHCDHCGHLLFFENTHCVRCGQLVAYLPDLALVGSLDQNRGENEGQDDAQTAALRARGAPPSKPRPGAPIVCAGTTSRSRPATGLCWQRMPTRSACPAG